MDEEAMAPAEEVVSDAVEGATEGATEAVVEAVEDGPKAPRWMLAAAAAAGVFIAAAPQYVFPVCEFEGLYKMSATGEPTLMRCHQTAMIAVWIGAALAAVGVAGALMGGKRVLQVCGVLVAVGGLATIALPIWIAPVCKTASMPCVAGTLPGLVVSGALVTVLGAGAVLLAKSKSG